MENNPNFMNNIEEKAKCLNIAKDILNINGDINVELIKKRYKQKALDYHPDHNMEKNANKNFILLNKAFNVLAHNDFSACKYLMKEYNYINSEENSWKHFLWWKNQFFKEKDTKQKTRKSNSCI